MVDATIVKARHGQGARSGMQGGMDQILALTDATAAISSASFSCPASRYRGRRPVIDDLAFEGFIADKAFDRIPSLRS